RSPNAFNLISPPDDTYVYEPITFVWETTDDGGQHDIHYNFWYSTEPDFTPREEITGLTESTFTLPIGTLDDLETYYWKVAASDGYEDTWSGCDIKGYWSFTVNERYRNIPKTFSLSEAYPNPSTGTAIIKFALPYACSIDLSLYDVKGRRITTLAEGRHQIGRHSITVTVLSGGVYLYKLEADEFSDVKKMVVR
ncbi:MAG: T9SS type A sorting domain-containing protein, partial [bacterium]|nr:T9SS type A sorting domain-containing protein [bacterium]